MMTMQACRALVSCAVLAAGGATGWAQKPTVSLAESVRQADLVIVAKVEGMIDTKPEAGTRKHLEAHWIVVKRTLKGIDCAGERLGARPNRLHWEDGRSYVLFTRRMGRGNFVNCVPQMSTKATPANIAAAVREIAVQGARVEPKPTFWMQYRGGWGAGVLKEFIVVAGNRFEYRLRQARKPGTAAQVRIGRLPAKEYAALLAKVAKGGKGPAADDAGYVSFTWTDVGGKKQSKGYSMPRRPPVPGLLKAIDDLALKHGKPRLTAGQVRALAVKAAGDGKPVPLQSSNPHLGGTRPIANPLRGHLFWCIRRSAAKLIAGPPRRRFLCISRTGTVIKPFKVGQFAELLAEEPTSVWSDREYRDAAALYAHLSSVANQDGWKVLASGEDFLAIKFNMPKAGAALARRREAAKAVAAPRVKRAGRVVTVTFHAWHLIGGRLGKWTVRFGPRFEAAFESLGNFGGGGYD